MAQVHLQRGREKDRTGCVIGAGGSYIGSGAQKGSRAGTLGKPEIQKGFRFGAAREPWHPRLLRVGHPQKSLLPSFDPSSDEIKEYVEKVRFLQGICPQADKAMLAPRLSMLCRGTAWQQVRNIPSGTLTDPKKGVDALLAALSSWEEISEMQTYEKFEKALFKVYQKSDEAVNSYSQRMKSHRFP